MIQKSLRGCPICGGADCEPLHHQRFILPEGHPLSGGYDVVCCQDCGMVYADTPVPQAEFDRYYQALSHYEDPQVSTGGGATRFDRARIDQAAAFIQENFPNTGTSILEIGCANGGLLAALQRLGYARLVGVDPSPGCVAHTRQGLGSAPGGVDAVQGSLHALPPGLEKADLVILVGVLEHVADLRTAAQNIASVAGEAVYVEVPDAPAYADQVDSPFQDFNTEHINHFSHTCLANLWRQAGFEPSIQTRKVVEIAPGKVRPTLVAVYRRAQPGQEHRSGQEPRPGQNFRPGRGAIQPDLELAGAIRRYIEVSGKIISGLDAQIRRILEAYPEVIVWGTGQLAMKLLAETALGDSLGDSPAAFVDGNPVNQGKKLLGKTVLAPGALKSSGIPILITTTLHEQAILQTIRSLGLQNPVFTLQVERPHQ